MFGSGRLRYGMRGRPTIRSSANGRPRRSGGFSRRRPPHLIRRGREPDRSTISSVPRSGFSSPPLAHPRFPRASQSRVCGLGTVFWWWERRDSVRAAGLHGARGGSRSGRGLRPHWPSAGRGVLSAGTFPRTPLEGSCPLLSHTSLRQSPNSCPSLLVSDSVVREEGLEPSRVSPRDPKSRASSSSATLAKIRIVAYCLPGELPRSNACPDD